ncbi:hypothetical protein B0H13DRAFT_1896519 [Mycena leptocephala]|nr:hypothetical protein B0H13DRAFT_1896519 [Mycena leptocephala]
MAGLGMHTVHQLASTPGILVFMGSRKLAAAEEALSKFVSDLDITDDASMKNAHTFIAKYLQEHNYPVRRSWGPRSNRVNVFGTVAITQIIRPLLKDGGAILNISSGLASLHSHTQRPPPPIYPAYSSSKSALNSLTLQWAIQEEEKRSGIRVVSIDPGYNATNLNNYAGVMDPADGCKVIVNAALDKKGRSGVFFDKDGDVPW